MRKRIQILILLIPILSFSQKKDSWNEVTIKTLDSIKTELQPEQVKYFNLLISKREDYQTQKRIDTTNATISIVEGYNFSEKKYGIEEEFLFDNNQIYSYENDTKGIGVSFNDYEYFIEPALNKKTLDSIRPRKYTAVFGCSPNNRTIRKSRKIAKMAEKEGIITEKYVKIETLIDSQTGKTKVSFLIPKAGKREVQISYGPFYAETELEYWLK
ncbi:hypothetical protein DFQ05_0982 [Winogradskyella wandonensis]|uniref:Uncharacterized protein n=1 Tax=Winogradskyella wandonensis TaxID=1442586 RepID=A0A4R1KSG5_9FLAO|nr:hypothetical protein [Winogradskyella wandonensis]TCK67209.1 hypothetical protein DFQ05_0982 [Winogradskyella wandonensis]